MALVLLLGWILACGGSTRLDSTPAADPSTPAPIVTAQQLLADYEANGVAADQAYKNRVWMVQGLVTRIDTEILGRPYVVLGATADAFSGMQAVFKRDEQPLLAPLKKAQFLTVKCTLKGQILMNVLGEDCTIVR